MEYVMPTIKYHSSLMRHSLSQLEMHITHSCNLACKYCSHYCDYGYTGDMLFTVDRIISHVSQFMTLRMGDLLFTGTPAGVGAVSRGDRIEAWLEERKLLDFEIK